MGDLVLPPGPVNHSVQSYSLKKKNPETFVTLKI